MIMDLRFRRVKVGCYIFGVTMAILINLSPVLFLTLRERYGISYTALASLITVNFVTQLLVDLLLSFFSHKFNIPLAVKSAPILGIAGLIIYAVCPLLFPQNVKEEDPLNRRQEA